MSKTTSIELASPGTREIEHIASIAVFQGLQFWDKLTTREQGVVVDEGREVAKAMIVHGTAALALGQHLAKLHDMLDSKGYFHPFLKKFTRLNPKQAYRLMNGYKNAAERLSEPVLKAAMARNIRIFSDDPDKPLGVHTDAVRQLEGTTKGRVGPGPNADQKEVDRWLNQVEQHTKQRRSVMLKAKRSKKLDEEVEAPLQYDEAQKLAYRFVTKMLKRSTHTPKKRIAFIEELAGMLLQKQGVSGARVSAVAVPDDYEPRPVGRPQLVKAVAK